MNASPVCRALATAIGAAILVCASIATALNYHEFPAPFVWLDVAVVYFLAALPFAASIAATVWRPSTRAAGYFSLVAIELAVLILIPRVYIQARTQSDMARAIDLVQQSRLGEAGRLMHRTIQLAPHAAWNGRQLAKLAKSIDENVARLEANVASPLAASASDRDYLQRAEFLAMLGRANEGLALLDSSPTLAKDASACNLRGTIYETRREWQSARGWYAESKSAWQTISDSPEKVASLARATTGIAFCERKLGHLREAEAAWLELLALAPSADSHFLLAQFYEDTQQTAKSRFHAEEAMKLDPGHYREPASKLLNNLVTSHFGCLGVFQPSETLAR